MIIRSYECRFARAMASGFEHYAKTHEGRLPTSWEEWNEQMLQPGYVSIDERWRSILPTRRYAFLAQPVPLLPPYEGELIMTSRRPFRESNLGNGVSSLFSSPMKAPGRYLIYRQPSGEFHSHYATEEYVQSLFRGRESLLPTPDTEPMRESEVKAERAWLIHRCVVGGLALLGLCFIPRSLWRLPGRWARAARAAQEGAV